MRLDQAKKVLLRAVRRIISLAINITVSSDEFYTYVLIMDLQFLRKTIIYEWLVT